MEDPQQVRLGVGIQGGAGGGGHTFSAFWLRSSVVSVLNCVNAVTVPTGHLTIHSNFLWVVGPCLLSTGAPPQSPQARTKPLSGQPFRLPKQTKEIKVLEYNSQYETVLRESAVPLQLNLIGHSMLPPRNPHFFDEAAFLSSPILFISPDKYAQLVFYIYSSQPTTKVLKVVKKAIEFYGLPIAYHCERLYKNMTMSEKLMHSKLLQEIMNEITKRVDEAAYSPADLSFFFVKEAYSPDQQDSYDIETRICCASTFRSNSYFEMKPSHQLEYVQEFPKASKDLARLVCSFLNSKGGIILIGAQEVAFGPSTRWRVKPLANINAISGDIETLQLNITKSLNMISNIILVHQRVKFQIVPVMSYLLGKAHLKMAKGHVVRIVVERDPNQRVFSIEKDIYVRVDSESIKLPSKDFYEYRIDRLAKFAKETEGKSADSIHLHEVPQVEEHPETHASQIEPTFLAEDQRPRSNSDILVDQIRQLFSTALESSQEKLQFQRRQETAVMERNQSTRQLMFQNFRWNGGQSGQ